MKKQYHAPYLAIESYQLDAPIAASCSSQGLQPINYSGRNGNCGVIESGNGYWEYFGDMFTCVVDCVPDAGDEYVCYQAPFYYADYFTYS